MYISEGQADRNLYQSGFDDVQSGHPPSRVYGGGRRMK